MHLWLFWLGYAVMEMQQGNYAVAQTLFSQAIKRAPDHAQSYQAFACLEVVVTSFSSLIYLFFLIFFSSTRLFAG
jgi:hypothetical protein